MPNNVLGCHEAVATVGKELITIDHKTDAIEGDARS
jgi:hypothetical protein